LARFVRDPASGEQARRGRRPEKFTSANRYHHPLLRKRRYSGSLAAEQPSVVRGDELLDDRRNPLAPFAAVEDAVMADIPGHEIFLLRRRKARRDVERGLRLAPPGNVVALVL